MRIAVVGSGTASTRTLSIINCLTPVYDILAVKFWPICGLAAFVVKDVVKSANVPSGIAVGLVTIAVLAPGIGTPFARNEIVAVPIGSAAKSRRLPSAIVNV